MNPKFDHKYPKTHTIEIGVIHFYPNILITEINQGAVLNVTTGEHLLALVHQYFGNHTSFVYIANRINSYSFDPADHFKTLAMFPNIIGYTTIAYNEISYKIAEFEGNFVSIPFKICKDLEEARTWGKEILASHDKSIS